MQVVITMAKKKSKKKKKNIAKNIAKKTRKMQRAIKKNVKKAKKANRAIKAIKGLVKKPPSFKKTLKSIVKALYKPETDLRALLKTVNERLDAIKEAFTMTETDKTGKIIKRTNDVLTAQVDELSAIEGVLFDTDGHIDIEETLKSDDIKAITESIKATSKTVQQIKQDIIKSSNADTKIVANARAWFKREFKKVKEEFYKLRTSFTPTQLEADSSYQKIIDWMGRSGEKSYGQLDEYMRSMQRQMKAWNDKLKATEVKSKGEDYYSEKNNYGI